MISNIIKAIRVGNDGKEVQVEVKFEIKDSILRLIEGNITGHECWHLKDVNLKTRTKFYLCLGTKGSWDSLYLESEGMSSLRAFVKGSD